MFRNYLKLAIRHLNRGRLFSTINVIGLSMSVTLTLLIAAYCWSEWQVPGEAVGRMLRLFSDPQPYTVSGVVKNFHFEGMNNAIQTVKAALANPVTSLKME